jgi:hypothetical protein
MLKLKLESLTVETFVTTPAAPPVRGTVNAHSEPQPAPPSIVCTYDVEECGETQYFDCSFGCSVDTACAHVCGASDEVCG